MNEFTLVGTVLEDKGKRSFVKDGKTIEYRNAVVRIGDTMVRVKTLPDVDLKEHIDQEVTLVFKLSAASDLTPTFRVVEVR